MQQQKTGGAPERPTRYRDKCVDESDRQQKKAKTQQLSRATTFTDSSSSSAAPPPTDAATTAPERKGVVEKGGTDEDVAPKEDGTTLAQICEKTKTTGKGVQLLQKIAYYFQNDDDLNDGDK